MSTRITVGVGCRLGCPASVIEKLVEQALDQMPATEVIGLFTIVDKIAEAGITEAARRLGLHLAFLPHSALQAQTPLVQTHSPRAQSLFGVPSVAEAAALAGAGAGAILILPRLTGEGATCAVAKAQGQCQ